MSIYSRRVLGLVLLMWLLATITVGLQTWIGDQTVYSRQLEAQREAFHFGILENKAPGGASWAAVGGRTVQKRIGVVYLAEVIRKHTTLSVGKIYKLLDSVFLFVSLLGLFFFLSRWVPDIYCLLGVLYFCAMLPLTYFFQLFHPWDRLQLAIWIGLLFLIADRRFVLLAIGLFISVLVKFDTVLLPFFYFAVHLKKNQWQKTCFESVALLILVFSTYFVLGQIFPDPLEHDVGFNWSFAFSQLQKNTQTLIGMTMRFPPLLVHALPVFLSLFFLQSKDRFVWTAVAFALGLSAVYIMFSNYEEVRAHMVVLVLVLPSALLTLKHFLNLDETSRLQRVGSVNLPR